MQDRPTKTRPDLFTPIEVGPLKCPNRVVMAPLTRSRAGAGNVPTALNALYYAQRASAGLIISEATQVAPEGQGYISTPGIHSAEQIRGWQCVTGAVHVAGGRIVLQLWHVGRISHPSFQPGGKLPVAPSAIRPNVQAYTANGFEPIPTPRALETDEIPAIVQQYAHGALNALAAGFDGVEVHGANGYLIDQFLRDGTNKRTDAYGGSIENRTRFLLEVVDAVTAVVGADRTGLRISPQNGQSDISDSDPERLFNHVASVLSGKGLSYLHVIEGDTGGTPVPPFDYKEIKRRFGGMLLSLDGHLGLAGWQWLFLAEGVPSVLLGIVVWFVLVDRPADASWLTTEERDWLTTHLAAERERRAGVAETSAAKALTSGIVWWLAILYFLAIAAELGPVFFGPVLLSETLHISSLTVGYMMGAIGLAGVAGMLLNGAHSDRSQERVVHASLPMCLMAAGFIVTALAHNAVTLIAGLALISFAVNAFLPVFWCVPSALLSGTAAAGGIALINSIGNLGGFAAPNIVGWARAMTGNYVGSMLVLGFFAIVAALMMAAVPTANSEAIRRARLRAGRR